MATHTHTRAHMEHVQRDIIRISLRRSRWACEMRARDAHARIHRPRCAHGMPRTREKADYHNARAFPRGRIARKIIFRIRANGSDLADVASPSHRLAPLPLEIFRRRSAQPSGLSLSLRCDDRVHVAIRRAFPRGTFKLIYLARQNGAQPRLRAALPLPASSCGAFELANQFNRAVGRSKKIIGAGWLFKIRRPRIVSGSQSYRDPARAFARSRARSLCYKLVALLQDSDDL